MRDPGGVRVLSPMISARSLEPGRRWRASRMALGSTSLPELSMVMVAVMVLHFPFPPPFSMPFPEP